MTGRVRDRTVDEPGLLGTGAVPERAGVPEPDVGGVLDDRLKLDVGSGGGVHSSNELWFVQRSWYPLKRGFGLRNGPNSSDD